MSPRLMILQRKTYANALTAYLARRHEKRPWYTRYFGILPRAFYDPENRMIVVLKGHESNFNLVAHEYGHYLGRQHPPVTSPWYYLDVMGYGPRVLDAHRVKPRAAAWLKGERA